MWHLCSNCFTKHHCIRVFHHLMGDQVPWHHLQGHHVVLVTIIPLAQTPQPFQLSSAQNLEYVTLFSFCKKLFCMKKSQQIKAIFLKKRACEWRFREFRAGPLSCRPSCRLMAQGQLVPHTQHCQWWHDAHIIPQKNLYGSDYEPHIRAGDELFIVTRGLPSTATQAGR